MCQRNLTFYIEFNTRIIEFYYLNNLILYYIYFFKEDVKRKNK